MTGTPVARRPLRLVKKDLRISMRTVSIVVPAKDERDNVEPLYLAVKDAIRDSFNWELIYVDDGSVDGTFDELVRLAKLDPRVKVVRLRRNFGQASAMQAGIDAAAGDFVATLDGDLQNDPADIPAMIYKIDEGYDVCLGERVKRQDKLFIRKVPSKVANWMIRKITKLPFRDFGCTTRVMKQELAHQIRIYGEMHRFIPVLANNLGARMAQIPVRHHARRAGKSKYGIGRTTRVMLDLITIKYMSGYLTRPMHFMGGIGLLFITMAFLSLAGTVAMKLDLFGFGERTDMTGNPLLLLSALFSLAGVQFISTGLIGEVLTRTYFESQDKRPYVVRESRNLDDDENNRETRAA
jgi:glycosyltransferase involved in cell wall biosynthesis